MLISPPQKNQTLTVLHFAFRTYVILQTLSRVIMPSLARDTPNSHDCTENGKHLELEERTSGR